MLLGPASGGGSVLVPAKAQLTAAALREYRELLRKTRSNRSDESSSLFHQSLFQQAKERVLLRLQQPQPRVDPRRAFARLSDRLAAARLTLRALKNEQREKLQEKKAWIRQYVTNRVTGSSNVGAAEAGLESSGSGGAGGAAALAAVQRSQPAAVASAGVTALDERAAAAVMGSNGPLRHLVIAAVGGTCKLFLAAGARTSVEGQERIAAAMERPAGQGLITVSNHVGSIDDPLITASIVPADKLLRPEAMRWTMCATDRCFKSALLAPFFRAAKVLPVERGAGMSQFGMHLARARLAEGEWVHIFPEGTRSRDGRMQPVRKGVGWLVASAAASGGQPPLVLPFVHSGMERVLPKGRSLPKLGQELKVLVGEPVPVADLLMSAEDAGWSEQELHVAIADRVGQALYRLKAQLEGLPLKAVAPQPAAAAISISEDTLLPLIEEELDSLLHRWQDRWQRLSLPSLTQRMRGAVDARREALRARLAAFADPEGGAAAPPAGTPSCEDGAAAAEEGAGVTSSWASLPWAGPAEAEAAWGAVAARPADRSAVEMSLDGDWEAQAGCAAGQAPGLLARQALRLLRGGSHPGAAAGSGAGASAARSSGGPQEFAAAFPLDAVELGTASSTGGNAFNGSLPALLAAAADYSAARVQHMQRLLSAGRGSPAPASLAGAF